MKTLSILGLAVVLFHTIAVSTTAAAPLALESLLLKVETIRTVIYKRATFEVSGPVEKTDQDPEYFMLEEVTVSPVSMYGNDDAKLTYRTDGSVTQLLFKTVCAETASALRIQNMNECRNVTWVTAPEAQDGVVTVSVPVAFAEHNYEVLSAEVEVYACRYNGCRLETTTTITHKANPTFGDQVSIFDRYEWEYEWNNKIHHVQEVLLRFPTDSIKQVKLRVTCDVSGLYIKTTEEDRATCYSRRDYSPVDFGDEEIDDVGNIYDLRIESVTNNIQSDQAGAVVMNFLFIDWQNRVVYETTYRPEQRNEASSG